MGSRAAFAEKRPPQFKGWDNPEDRCRLPELDRTAQQCQRPEMLTGARVGLAWRLRAK
jgi:hypothetical protein